VARTNKRSLNHMADRLIMSAARARKHEPLSMEDGVELMTHWLEEKDFLTDDTYLDTGSGLSYQSRLSTRQVVGVLREAAGYTGTPPGEPIDAGAQAFRNSLSIATVDGTLRHRFRLAGHRIHLPLRGKTGTLKRVIALSGFLEHPDGRTLCFSILSNGHPIRFKRRVRQAHEILVTHLEKFLSSYDPTSYLALLRRKENASRVAGNRFTRARSAAYTALLGGAGRRLVQ
jgi:D-alanyl-D-alanine carboxypeptidase